MRNQIWETKVTWLRPHSWAIPKWKTNVPVLSILKKIGGQQVTGEGQRAYFWARELTIVNGGELTQ